MSGEFVKIPCPKCGKRLKLAARKTHKKVVCPKCSYTFRLGDDNLVIPVSSEAENDRNSATTAGETSLQPPPLAANTEVERSTASQTSWAKNATLTESDDKAQQGGILLLILSIFGLVAPFFGFSYGEIPWVGQVLPLLGVLLGLVGTVLVAFAMRGAQLSAALTALAIGTGVCTVGTLGFFKERAKSIELADTDTELETDSHSSEIEDASPGRRIVRREDMKIETPDLKLEKVNTKANGDFGDVDQPVVRTSSRDPQKSLEPVEPTSRNNPSQMNREEFIPDKSKASRVNDLSPGSNVSDNRNPFASAPRTNVPNGARNLVTDSAKRKQVEKQLSNMTQHAVSQQVIRDQQAAKKYAVSDPVGKSTVFGKAYLLSTPVKGVDWSSFEDSPKIEFVVPCASKLSNDTLLGPDSTYLAGLNVFFEDGLIGVQGIFAPRKDQALNMDDAVVGPWSNVAKPSDRNIWPLEADGKPVYGIVVYREKLSVVGIALIVKR